MAERNVEHAKARRPSATATAEHRPRRRDRERQAAARQRHDHRGRVRLHQAEGAEPDPLRRRAGRAARADQGGRQRRAEAHDPGLAASDPRSPRSRWTRSRVRSGRSSSSTRRSWPCSQQGVVARARRVQGKGDDSVVKLRPVVPARSRRRICGSRRGFGVEVDAMPGGYVCSASMKGDAGGGRARDTITGGEPLRKLFSQAPAGVLRRARAGWRRARRPVGARPDLRAEAEVLARRSSIAGWSPSCGSTPTAVVCSSCPPNACPRRPFRWPPKRGPSSRIAA